MGSILLDQLYVVIYILINACDNHALTHSEGLDRKRKPRASIAQNIEAAIKGKGLAARVQEAINKKRATRAAKEYCIVFPMLRRMSRFERDGGRERWALLSEE